MMTRKSLILVFLFMALFLVAGSGVPLVPGAETGEEQPTSLSLTRYEGSWFSFNYPRGWKIMAEEEVEGAALVVLQTLGNGVVSISRFPAERGFDLPGYSTKALERWKERFPEDDVRDQRVDDIQRFSIPGREATIRIHTLLGWEDVTHEFFAITTPKSFYFLHFNGPTEARSRGMQREFDTILESFDARETQ